MAIILKIFLGILSVAFGYVSYFIISEFGKFRKSEESLKASLLEKFVLGAITFIGISVMVLSIIFSVIVIFSEITIRLPF